MHIYAPTLFSFSKVEIKFPLRRSEDGFLVVLFSVYKYFACTVAIIPLRNAYSFLSQFSLIEYIYFESSHGQSFLNKQKHQIIQQKNFLEFHY